MKISRITISKVLALTIGASLVIFSLWSSLTPNATPVAADSHLDEFFNVEGVHDLFVSVVITDGTSTIDQIEFYGRATTTITDTATTTQYYEFDFTAIGYSPGSAIPNGWTLHLPASGTLASGAARFFQHNGFGVTYGFSGVPNYPNGLESDGGRSMDGGFVTPSPSTATSSRFSDFTDIGPLPPTALIDTITREATGLQITGEVWIFSPIGTGPVPGESSSSGAPGLEFGDAPDSSTTTFPTLPGSSGPAHLSHDLVFLGHGVDGEHPLDPITVDEFDDGIIGASPLTLQVTMPSGTTTVPLIADAPEIYVNVLADLDLSMGWDAASEWVGVDIPVPLVNGSITSTLAVAGFDLGTLPDGVWIRISLTDERLQDTLGEKPTSTFWDGSWGDFFIRGETEDHVTPVTVSPSVTSMVYGDIRFQSVALAAQVRAIEATVSAQSLTSAASSTVSVSSDGSFFITDLSSDAYSITASADGFIELTLPSVAMSSTGTAVLVNPEPATPQPPGTAIGSMMRAGLVNSDNVVNIRDISAVANSFGELVSDRKDSFGRTVDINADGIVSILDLSAVASNFGTPSPLAWPE